MNFELARDTEGLSCVDIESVVEKEDKALLREQKTGIESLLCIADLNEVLSDPIFGKGTVDGLVYLGCKKSQKNNRFPKIQNHA